MALSQEQKAGLKSSVCEDCSLQISWPDEDCPCTEDCHAQLMALFGVADKSLDRIEDSSNGDA